MNLWGGLAFNSGRGSISISTWVPTVISSVLSSVAY
jgi:hypothetical protein